MVSLKERIKLAQHRSTRHEALGRLKCLKLNACSVLIKFLMLLLIYRLSLGPMLRRPKSIPNNSPVRAIEHHLLLTEANKPARRWMWTRSVRIDPAPAKLKAPEWPKGNRPRILIKIYLQAQNQLIIPSPIFRLSKRCLCTMWETLLPRHSRRTIHKVHRAKIWDPIFI